MKDRDAEGADDGSTQRLKKSIVDDAPLPPKGARSMIWDTDVKGFGVRITAAGTRTYILRYRMGGRGSPIRTLTIGQHGSPWTTDQARKRAADLLLQVRSGIDVVAERHAEKDRTQADAASREERLFSALVEAWFINHVVRDELRSRNDIRGVIDRDLKPAFAGKTVDEITKKDVAKALNAIGERSGAAANKAHKWLRQILNWLIDQGEIRISPAAGVKKPFPENSRTRVLSLGELVVLWVALDALPEPYRSYYRLLILLGQRLRETSNAPWAEFDLEADDWLLPRERTKAKRDHLVPLSPQAVALLETLQPNTKLRKGPVFTTDGQVGIAGFSKLKAAIDDAVAAIFAEGGDAAALVGEDFADWVVHDIRRSLATGCQGMGIELVHTEAVLNHAVTKKVTRVTEVYHLYDYYDEKAWALERWGELIEKAVALFRAGDLDGVRALDPARRTRTRRKRHRDQE